MPLISQGVTAFRAARSANSTDSSFPSRVPTTTEPTGSGVIDLCAPAATGGGQVYPNLLLVFYGAGADDSTFEARVIGWRAVSTLWVPVPLCQLACTLSTAVGVASAAVTNSERFADTLALGAVAVGNEDVSLEIISPANNLVAHALLNAKGFAKVEVTFDMTGATSGNCLYAVL